MKNFKEEQQQKLKNAQINTLLLGCIIGVVSFAYGATLTNDNPVKHNLIFLIGFAELVVIFSLVSIFFNRNK